jgi:L-iditol 2-dehydrogenase
MPTSMQAMKFPEAGRAEIVRVPVPVPGPGQVLIRARATGICYSDVEAFKGTHSFRCPPVITGHELAGEVAALGPGVTARRVGDRVAIEPHAGCGACPYCRQGLYHACPQKRLIGVGDWIGAFAEFVVATESMCHAIPDGMSFPEAAALEPFCVGLHAVRRGQPQLGERVAILGAGTIGLMTLLAARAAGPQILIVSEPSPAKREIARACGADLALDPRTADVVAEIQRASEGVGADLVFVAVSVPEALRQGIEACRRVGRLVIVASFFGDTALEARQIQLRERTVIGTCMYTAEDYRLAIGLWRAGRLDLKPLLTDFIGLADAPATVAALAAHAKPDSIKTTILFE